MHDWQWGMPTENWGQTGSYIGPALPPLEDPDAGTLIQLPCINRDYLPLLLGCCDQLRNPSSWDPSIGDNGLSLALNKWSRLRQMLGRAIGVSCVPPVQYRFTADCHLQTSSDGGVTWVTVPGWDTNLDSCIKSHIPPLVPPNPRGDLIQQHACDIAGFLATAIIQKTMVVMESYVGTTNEQVQFARDLISAIGFAFPITYQVAQAAYGFYQDVVAQLLAEVQAAGSDPNLWAAATCAIYNSIKVVGYVDATNFSACQAALHAIVYAHPWVPNAIGNYWGAVGLGNIQSLQAEGAIDHVDCTNCGTWCYKFDFSTGNAQGWSILPPYAGALSAQGWISQPNGPRTEVVIRRQFAPPVQITLANLSFGTSAATGAADDRKWVITDDGGTQHVYDIDRGLDPLPTHSSTGPISINAADVWVVLRTDGAGNSELITDVELRGPGPNPFGADNCTY